MEVFHCLYIKRCTISLTHFQNTAKQLRRVLVFTLIESSEMQKGSIEMSGEIISPGILFMCRNYVKLFSFSLPREKCCECFPQSLPKLLQCVKWHVHEDVAEVGGFSECLKMTIQNS